MQDRPFSVAYHVTRRQLLPERGSETVWKHLDLKNQKSGIPDGAAGRQSQWPHVPIQPFYMTTWVRVPNCRKPGIVMIACMDSL